MKFIFSLSCGTVVMDVGLWARNVSGLAPPGSAVLEMVPGVYPGSG